MGKKTILVVDDDADLRLGLDIRLKANGYRVVFAADGEASIAAARLHAPDLILLDLGLPGGDGYSVMEQLRVSAMHLIPVIVLSAREKKMNFDRTLQVGAYTFLQKPVDTADLMGAVHRALGESQRKPRLIKGLDQAGQNTESRMMSRILCR